LGGAALQRFSETGFSRKERKPVRNDLSRPAQSRLDPVTPFQYCSTSNIPNRWKLQYFVSPMNKADSDRIHQLCSLIVKEQDRAKFLSLAEELNQILEAHEERLKSREHPD
jgi:hypothetical protein